MICEHLICQGNKTGRHRSVKAPPEERLERPVPHLAFIDPTHYDRVIALLRQRNAKFRRGRGGQDPRQDLPRKRTRWPGQHLNCGVCGRPYYLGGHGRKNHLMCSGSRNYVCWNSITVFGPMAAERIADAVRARIDSLPDFEVTFTALVHAEIQRRQAAQSGLVKDLDRRQADLDRSSTNIGSAIREAGPSPILIAELRRIESEMDQLRLECQELAQFSQQTARIPTADQIRELARHTFADLASDSAEFGRLMRRLIPRLEVLPYRLCDGGGVVPRAHLTLDLVALIPEFNGLDGIQDLLRQELIVDLFDPPQRAAYRQRVLDLQAAGKTTTQIAQALGLTKTAVQRALALDRRMRSLGLDDPYCAVKAPEDQTRFRRYRHPRFRFEPTSHLDGADSSANNDSHVA
jgi:site-specific DNA recombinase